MSDKDNETIVLPLIDEVMDPLEVRVREWVIQRVQNELDEEFDGLNISFQDLGTLILSCFDEVQELLLAEIIPPGTTIH